MTTELPEHLHYLANLPKDALLALNGTSQGLYSLERENVESLVPRNYSKVYQTAELGVQRATQYEETPLHPASWKPKSYTPRLFGRRFRREDLTGGNRAKFIASTILSIYDEIDRIFLPSHFEYRDGSVPANIPQFGILRVIEWIPFELIPLPQSPVADEYAIRTVINVEYTLN